MNLTINQIINNLKNEYEFVGIRTNDKLNAIGDKSNIWIDNNFTKDKLDGLSCTDINSDYVNSHFNGEYSSLGKIKMIVAGDYASKGEDIAEIIIEAKKIIRVSNIEGLL